jgi:hypothetical protein
VREGDRSEEGSGKKGKKGKKEETKDIRITQESQILLCIIPILSSNR